MMILHMKWVSTELDSAIWILQRSNGGPEYSTSQVQIWPPCTKSFFSTSNFCKLKNWTKINPRQGNQIIPKYFLSWVMILHVKWVSTEQFGYLQRNNGGGHVVFVTSTMLCLSKATGSGRDLRHQKSVFKTQTRLCSFAAWLYSSLKAQGNF